jgi:TPR repeat protein
MISAYSPWLSAHGKLWYDDKWYRIAWIVWPQALAALVVLWFWAMPSTGKTARWGAPLDPATRADQLLAQRDTAKSSRAAMDTLERDASGGEMNAEFFLATLYDPDLKLSTIVKPDFDKAAGWYNRAAAQGHQLALNNLALFYAFGTYTRIDYTRACYYALKLTTDAPGNGLNVKGDCYARGLGGTKIDQAQAASAFQAASDKGVARAAPVTPPVAPAPSRPAEPVPLAAMPPPMSPPDTSTELKWGALAFTADGSFSTAWKVASRADAEADVAKRCAEFGRGGCRVVSFSGQECLSLATFIGSYARRRWELSFTAPGTTYPEAQNAALGRCNSDERTRSRCQSRTTACADGR